MEPNSPQNVTPIAVTPTEGSYHVQVLRNHFIGAMAALILVSGSFLLFMYVQMGMVRGQLADQRPAVLKSLQEFKQNNMPLMERFNIRIRNYAASNANFRPILQKYDAALSEFLGNSSLTPVAVPAPATNK
jgi:hypothetical protein